MSISYNYFLPTNIYGTLRVVDLGLPGYTAVNANIYCQRNINCDGQLQCGQFHALGTAYFDVVPTCITNATSTTQLTNYQTVQGLISSAGFTTLGAAINGVHTSTLPFTSIQTIQNNLIVTDSNITSSRLIIIQNASAGQCIFQNTGNTTGSFIFTVFNGINPFNVLTISSASCTITSTNVSLTALTTNSLICSTTATFNGNYPTTTLGNNSGLNNNELATVGYVKSIGGSSILSLNNLFTGTNTFQVPIITSGASISSNTIPALSIVDNSITNTQIASGYQLITTNSQTFSGVKTLSNLLNSTGITDTVSISSPLISGGYFQATGTTTSTLNNTTISGILTTNNINTSASTPLNLNIGTVTLPTATDTGSGCKICWNGLGTGTGETDFINLGQGTGASGGGFLFGTLSNTLTNINLMSIYKYANQGLWLLPGCGRLRIDDHNGGAFYWTESEEGATMQMSNNGISTAVTIACGNASGVLTTALTLNSTSVSPNINLNPLSTTTFNVSHPTSTLPTNISTNTTQYALVSYVNANSGTALLASNNTWTGTNAFTKPYISISSVTAPINIGSGTGNTGNVIIGNSACLSTVTTNSGSICIGGGLNTSLNLSTGTGNICVGNASGTAITTGNNNLMFANGCGTTISTASNNTIIGAGAWSTGTANFSNCTILGANAPAPVANNSIVIGSSAETVYVAGASQLNNSLLYGTTVCSSDVLQINNQTKRFHTTYTTGVANTLLNPLPFMILFTPIAGMSFILPVPSATNAGQTFILRRFATGGGQTITFTVTGNLAIWIPLNSGTATASFSISTVWQFTFYSTGTNYIAIC